MPIITLSPEEAWVSHIKSPAATSFRWMEDSKKISGELPLSKRELFGLILLAHLRRKQFGNNDWYVGYDISSEVTYEQMKEFVDEKRYTVDIHRHWHLKTLLEMHDSILPLLGQREWSLLIWNMHESISRRDCAKR